jgi:hypothetical protein
MRYKFRKVKLIEGYADYEMSFHVPLIEGARGRGKSNSGHFFCIMGIGYHVGIQAWEN